MPWRSLAGHGQNGVIPNPVDWFTKPPSPGCFAATLSRKGRGYLPAQRARLAPSPHPHPLADAVTWSGKLAKASLLGEGWGEGAFAEALSRIWHQACAGCCSGLK